MSYQIEIDKSDVQKLALTIAIIPCLLFAAGFLTATLSQNSPGTHSVSAKSNSDVIAPPPATTPIVSVISEITEPVAIIAEATEPVIAVTEVSEPVIATAEPVVAIDNEASAQEQSEATEEVPTPSLAPEEVVMQPLVSDGAPQVNQLFSVQVAAFREASNAIDYAVQLKAKGYPVEVTVENSSPESSVYKVLYGSFERDKALKSAADFSQQEKTTSFIIARL